MTARAHGFEFRKRASNIPPKSPSNPSESPRPSRLAWQLAFAYRVEREIAAGIHANRAAAARHYGISPARITQILNLLGLPTTIQEQILVPQTRASLRVRSEHASRKG